MLSGVIFVSEGILSLDLKTYLSKYYRIIHTFKKAEEVTEEVSNIDFIIIDSDPFSENELRSVLQKIKLHENSKIIALTSFIENQNNLPAHIKIPKPIDYNEIIDKIQA